MMYVSGYIIEYFKALKEKLELLDNLVVVDKLFYYYNDLLQDHKSFRSTISEQVKNKQNYVAIGCKRSSLRTTESFRAFGVGLNKELKEGGMARSVEFDLDITLLSNSAQFTEIFETYYICELFRNTNLRLDHDFGGSIGPLSCSCEHNDLSESSSISFDENTAGLMKITFTVKLSAVVISPYAKTAPYIDQTTIRYPG